MTSPSRRRDTDIMKLMMSDFEVQLGDRKDFYVKFYGPKESPYEKGIWKVHVTLPVEYPYKSPSIGFCNKIYHPNVDEASGTVCLDVINQTWSPMFDLLNIFSAFLPQLLLYPNPSDPLNSEAAALLLQNPKAYRDKVQEHVRKNASIDIKMDDDDEEEEDDDDGKGKGKDDDSDISRRSRSEGPSEAPSDGPEALEGLDDIEIGEMEMEMGEPLSDMDDDLSNEKDQEAVLAQASLDKMEL